MDWFWNALEWIFVTIFKVVPTMGLFFNKLLIVIGFVAFFMWLRVMINDKGVEGEESK